MIQAKVNEFVHEWRGNRRLRLGALAVLAILGLQLVLWRSDARAARVEEYRRGAELLARIESASRESAWIQRAAATEQVLQAQLASIPVVDSDGLAQAEMQAWLSDLAALAGIPDPTVRVENAIAVEGHPDLWQVLGRLDGTVPAGGIQVLVRTLSAAGPWFQVERLELQDGRGARLSMVLRGYFREGEAVANARRPADLPAGAPETTSGPLLAARRNPLAGPDGAAATSPAQVSSVGTSREPGAATDTSRSGARSAMGGRFPPEHQRDDANVPRDEPRRSARERRQPSHVRPDATRGTGNRTTVPDASGRGSIQRAPDKGGGDRPRDWDRGGQ